MRAEDIRKGMTVTVRPAVKGVARFDAIVDSVHGNFVRVLRGENKEPWTVAAHECQPYDGMTDFQRNVRNVAREFKVIPVADVITKVGRTVNEASVWRAARSHPLSNFVEIKRAEGNNRRERVAMLYWKEGQ